MVWRAYAGCIYGRLSASLAGRKNSREVFLQPGDRVLAASPSVPIPDFWRMIQNRIDAPP